MPTVLYRVEGMTCAHCVAAVTEELTTLDGVEDVGVDLNAGGVSSVTVTSIRPLARDDVEAALTEAGHYHLVGVAAD
jgi:copper chaperone CopZ